MTATTEIVHRAIDLSDDGDYQGALDLLNSAIRLDSNNAQAYFERGMVFLNLQQDARAVPDFDRALAINPHFPGARDWRSRALATLGDFQAAADDRLKDLQSHPDGRHAGMGVSPQQWADCADAFIKAGNPAKARELLEEYFKHFANRVDMYARYETAPMRTLATLLMQQQDSVRACAMAHQAYLSKHQCPADVMCYALTLEASGDLARAKVICAEAMKINDQMAGVRELHQRLVKRGTSGAR